MTKATAETTLGRTVGEPSPCLQCRHGRHGSTTPHLTATWAQDHDDNHVRTCTTRRHSLQAKLARPLPQAHDASIGRTFFLYICPGPELYIRATRAPSQLILSFFTPLNS
jgi:hypothetical protein